MRLCGNCTACCSTHSVKEIKKPAGELCGHCIEGVGCSIYDDRPRGCHGFACIWKTGLGTEAERPDRLGVVFDIAPMEGFGKRTVLYAYEKVRDASYRLPARRTLRAAVDNGYIAVVVRWPQSERPILIVPENMVLTFDESVHLSQYECEVKSARQYFPPVTAISVA